jgi:hypothetical protein
MKSLNSITGVVAISAMLTFAACSSQEEMAPKPAPAPVVPKPAPSAKAEAAPAKAKVTKAAGDVGLLDTEKNYMILVTKEGKLVTLDFDDKTKVTKMVPRPGKMADVGLGSTATVMFTKEGAKNIANGVEYKVKKGGD